MLKLIVKKNVYQGNIVVLSKNKTSSQVLLNFGENLCPQLLLNLLLLKCSGLLFSKSRWSNNLPNESLRRRPENALVPLEVHFNFDFEGWGI